MNTISLKHSKFEPGDIINIQGTSVASKLIQWVLRSPWSHSVMICCRLRSGEHIVTDMGALGIMVRPLSAFKGRRVEVYRIQHELAPIIGYAIVLAAINQLGRGSYAFHKVLYAGLINIPRRLLHPNSYEFYYEFYFPSRPYDIYQVVCYLFSLILFVVTFMWAWSPILRLFSKDKWLIFTKRVTKQIDSVKSMRRDMIDIEEFAEIVEAELKSYEQMGKAKY